MAGAVLSCAETQEPDSRSTSPKAPTPPPPSSGLSRRATVGGQKYQDSPEELLEPPTPGIPVERLTEAMAQSVSSKGCQRTEGDRIGNQGCAGLPVLGQDIRSASGGSCSQVSHRGEREKAAAFPRERGWRNVDLWGKPQWPFRSMKGRGTYRVSLSLLASPGISKLWFFSLAPSFTSLLLPWLGVGGDAPDRGEKAGFLEAGAGAILCRSPCPQRSA